MVPSFLIESRLRWRTRRGKIESGLKCLTFGAVFLVRKDETVWQRKVSIHILNTLVFVKRGSLKLIILSLPPVDYWV